VDSTNSEELTERYHIHAIPTFVFVDDEGNEIDRILGYLPPEEYLAEMTRIRNGINTYPDLMKQWDENPQDADVLLRLSTKVEGMAGLEAAIGYWEELFKLETADAKTRSTANFKLAFFHAKQSGDPEALQTLLRSEKDIDILMETHDALVSFYKSQKDTVSEAAAYNRYVDFVVGAGQESEGFLNGYAWRMTQLEQNLPNALERIDEAIAMFTAETGARDQAQIMDTKAEVLWKLGRIENAVAVMDSCIELQPEDQYYKDQKAKFLATS